MESPGILSFLLALLLLQFITIVQGEQSVSLIFPPPGKAGKTLSFTAGRKLHIQWQSTFPHVRLQIWQGPNEQGTLAFLTLLSKSNGPYEVDSTSLHDEDNTSNATQDYHWPVHPLAGMPTKYPMHVRILNPDEKDCGVACSERSVNFTVVDAVPSASASATPLPVDNSSGSGLALGVGLGLGLPLMAVISGLVTWLCLRRRLQTQIKTADAYEVPMSSASELSHLRLPPEASTGIYGGNAAYNGAAAQSEMRRDIQPVFELQPEVQRVEAPRDAERVELDSRARGWSWYGKPNDGKPF